MITGTAADRLARDAEVIYWDREVSPDPTELAHLCSDADALICTPSDRIDERLLMQADGLSVISNWGVGYDHIDVEAASRRSIPVGYTPGVLTEATADMAWGLILAASRRIVEADRYVHAGNWNHVAYDLLVGQDVYGATLGVVGYGQIGQAVGRRAVGFGMSVIHYSRTRLDDDVSTWETLDNLLRKADIVTLHTALTPSARGLIGERELSMMKPSAILVNTSRGGVVDQTALFRALATGSIGAAALDVVSLEPIPPGDPILSLSNCIVTPHIASASHAARDGMAQLAVANALAGLEGRRLHHCVNPEVYERL